MSGRPALFRGASARVVANILAKHGLRGGQAYIAEVGVRLEGTKGRTPLEVSLPTLQKVAAEHGVEFERGRPAKGKKKATVVKSKKSKKSAKKAKRGRPVGSKNKAKVVSGKKRGRPAGSKNKAKVAPVAGKRRGRPVGSKNKPKGVEVAPVAPVEVAQVVVETPVVETPVVETPVVETPVVETPVETVAAPAPATSDEVAA